MYIVDYNRFLIPFFKVFQKERKSDKDIYIYPEKIFVKFKQKIYIFEILICFIFQEFKFVF